MTVLTAPSFYVIVTVLTELIQLMFEVMDLIQINYRDSRPIYEQVKESFRKLILSGILPAGEKMPSVLELATKLTINPNTIQRAYRELEQEGYICSVPGKGSFVSDTADAAAAHRKELLARFRSVAAELRELGFSAEELQRIIAEEKTNG